MSISKFMSEDECTQDALEKGLVAFFRLPAELVLDLDDGAYANGKVSGCLDSNDCGAKSILVVTSKSGKGMHVYMLTDRVWSYKEAACLQAALGSDPKKEALTIIGSRGFSALYETPAEAIRVQKWRDSFKQKEEEEVIF